MLPPGLQLMLLLWCTCVCPCGTCCGGGGRSTTSLKVWLLSVCVQVEPCALLCSQMPSPVSCRCLAALDGSGRHLWWRLGCELPALLPDGENTFPVPLPACCHIPDSPDSCGTAASQRSPLQVFGFSRIILLNRTGTVLSPGLLQGKQ